MAVKNVPKEWAAVLEQDTQKQLEFVTSHLEQCVALNDHRKAAKFYINLLNSYIESRFPLTSQNRVHLAKLVMALITESNNPGLKGRWCHTVSRLLKKTLINGVPWNDRLDIEIAWRPLYDLLMQVTLPERGEIAVLNPSEAGVFRNNLVTLISKSRKYFAKTATAELLALFLPMLNPHDASFFFAQSCLVLFLPTSDYDQVASWLPTMLETFPMVQHAKPGFLNWMQLFARVAKHNFGKFDWAPHLPTFFTSFLHSLNLPISSHTAPHRTSGWPGALDFIQTKQAERGQSTELCLCARFARFIVYTMHKTSPTVGLLKNFLDSTITFFHPSNNGNWSSSFGVFLMNLSYYYAKRAGQETGTRLGYKKPSYPEEYFLDLKDETFATLLTGPAMQGLFSKDDRMIRAAGSCLRDLAYFHPNLILPNLIAEVEPALTTVEQSQRMLSMLKTLAVVWSPMINRRLYPAGGTALEKMLWLALPGIDTTDRQKTGRTFVWLTVVFYTVPFFNAKESDQAKTTTKDAVPEETDQDSEVRYCTLMLNEWCMELMKKLLNTLEHMDVARKGQVGVMDWMFQYNLEMAVTAFGSCASREIFTECWKFVENFLLSGCFPEVSKCFGVLVACMGYCQPSIVLPSFVPALTKKIIAGLTSGMSDAQLQWYMYLLAQVVKRAGADEGLLPYLSSLREVSALGREAKDKKVSKYANRVLRNTLRAMSRVYATEMRPFSDKVWSEDKWSHWRVWGRYSELESCDELNIKWHFPSEKEQAAIKETALAELEGPLKVLETEATSPSADADNKKALKALAVVEIVTRSCESMLGPIEGKEEPQTRAREDAGVPLEFLPYTPMLAPIMLQLGGKSISV